MKSMMARTGTASWLGGSWTKRAEIEELLREARRALMSARHTTEDVAAAAALKVRKRPLASVSMAACTGTLIGTVVGFAFGRFRKSRT